MASYIQDKLFTDGFNLGAPLFVQGGVNGKYVIAANQIAWGDESYFNGAKFGGTTVGLLSAIEAACAGINPDDVNDIIKEYLDEHGVSIPEEYVTQEELSAMGYITSSDLPVIPVDHVTYTYLNNTLSYYIHEDELDDAVSAKGFIKSNALPTKVSELENDSAFITRNDLPTDHVTYTYLENTLSNYILEDNLNTAVSAAGFIKSNALPTKVSELENDSNFITIDEIPSYYITEKELSAMSYITLADVPVQEIVAADLWEDWTGE